MPPWLALLLQKGAALWSRVDWSKVWNAAVWLVTHAWGRFKDNLTEKEQEELVALVRKGTPRPSVLTEKERNRVRVLVWKALTKRELK
jgi:hypothetical protein